MSLFSFPRLREFGAWRRTTFATDLAAGAHATVNDEAIELRFDQPVTFDILSLEEKIELGQRVQAHRVLYQDTAGVWQWLIEAHTIGCKKLERFNRVTVKVIRL